ncbi:hypothetical protein TTX_1289 [Thermoproteus tenax Kra 1]|uniref:Uncharacterized protein n=1 Tax=Thermoproteus tenax (strain ATCC 35583 / DSM 2078 / JCM 9277 / NBRC 100435 / Kra 1) TaxID=768679 RepID=G4RK29_THETK|nr:hypothetical protein TTX_1289 [Thermoproteus tenax Kra 1]
MLNKILNSVDRRNGRQFFSVFTFFQSYYIFFRRASMGSSSSVA